VREQMIVECCLSGVLGRRLMREGLRDPEQLHLISKLAIQAYRQLDTIIRVDKIVFKGILIIVLVWVRGSCSAGHHGGHVIKLYAWSF
jgi:hypothetical protein